MTRILSCFIFALIAVAAHAQTMENATTAVRNMGLGWNLGNTLDAHSQKVYDYTLDSYWGGQGLESETCWGQPLATPELILMLKNAGFGAIRVPVTWYNHLDAQGNVDAKWMARVHTVVDYVISQGLYCIINVHHDTGADGTNRKSWIKADRDNYNLHKSRYEHLWTQIANEFRDYDKLLLFEAYNEMLDNRSSWCYASMSAPGGYDVSSAQSAYDGLNGYAQSFVDAVRATGGNNATRNLIVNTYAAANGYGDWSTHLKEPLTRLTIPNDTESGHIIAQVHAYPNLTTTSSQGTVVNRTANAMRIEVDGMISVLKSAFISKGIPVVFGEWGTSNVDAGEGKTDYDLRRTLMFQFASYFVSQCKSAGIATFYWMGLTNGIYRSVPAFNQADLARQLATAYHGSDFQGEFPEMEDVPSITMFDGDKRIEWGNGITIGVDMLKMMTASVQVELTYRQDGSQDQLQLYYGDWSTKPKFTIDGKTFSGDFIPHSHYATPNGTSHTTVITFSASVYSELLKRGLIIHGNDIRLTRAVLINPNISGIQPVISAPSVSSAVYNLSGQRISAPQRGIYIQNGRKVLSGSRE